MKLGALKSAIRAAPEAPKAKIRRLDSDEPFVVALQKTPLLAELDRHFPGGKATETGLRLTDDGYFDHERD